MSDRELSAAAKTPVRKPHLTSPISLIIRITQTFPLPLPSVIPSFGSQGKLVETCSVPGQVVV